MRDKSVTFLVTTDRDSTLAPAKKLCLYRYNIQVLCTSFHPYIDDNSLARNSNIIDPCKVENKQSVIATIITLQFAENNLHAGLVHNKMQLTVK